MIQLCCVSLISSPYLGAQFASNIQGLSPLQTYTQEMQGVFYYILKQYTTETCSVTLMRRRDSYRSSIAGIVTPLPVVLGRQRETYSCY
jgi:hypothetical protein